MGGPAQLLRRCPQGGRHEQLEHEAAGLDLEAWESSDTGELVEYDRGPDHLILRNCHISGVDDSGNPGQGQRDVTVNFTAETDKKITA